MGIKVPEGKFISTVKVGEKGQIVTTKAQETFFDIKPERHPVVARGQGTGMAIVQLNDVSASEGDEI